jgi:aspartate racemase
MATVGIVGGLGPESTIDYYRRILAAWKREDPSSAPSIVIDSLDAQRALTLVGADRRAFSDYLFESLQRLAGAGVDFAVLSANTAHIVFDDLSARSPVPLLSIVEACAAEARRLGLKRVALLGTRFTMEATFYPEVCVPFGVEVVTPTADQRDWVHERYIGELLKGDFREDTRQEFISLVERLRRDERIDGVILGGTELPLLLRDASIAGVPVLDTTGLHVSAIVQRLRGAPAR